MQRYDAITVSEPRSCFRCGAEFRRYQGERICPGCRRITQEVTAVTAPSKTLSQREKQIVSFLKEGKSNKEIAFRLHLTEGTVKEYMHRLFRKIGAENRTQVAVWAYGQKEG